jgi:hypothetical protein
MSSIRNTRQSVTIALALLSAPVPSHADSPIYMCVDEYGRRSFTNVRSEMKGRKCERQTEAALPVAPGAKTGTKSPGSATPPDFPKVEAGTQKARDDVRRKVLADELANEQKLMAQAVQGLDEARKPRTGEVQGSQKTLERVNDAEKEVQRHRQNIESLQREIGALK